MRLVRTRCIVTIAALTLLVAGCSGAGKKKSAAAPPAPASSAATAAISTTARPVGSNAARNGGTPGSAAGRLNCLDGLKTYRYNGHLALTQPPGASNSQIASLANLLADVKFDGAYQAPDSSALNVTFPGADGSQDLQTIKSGGKFYQKAGQSTAPGGWQLSTGAGPIVGTLSQLDPQTLCDQTIAQIDTTGVTPAKETLNGNAALHYSFGPAELARTPGIFGERDRNQGAPPEAQLDVWMSQKENVPVRIALKSSFGETGGGQSLLNVLIDIDDFNGGDVSIKAPI